MKWIDFLKSEQSSRDTIDFKKIYVDMAGGDLVAGLMLSEIVYWHLPSKNGGLKLRVSHKDKVTYEDKMWIAENKQGWWEKCRINPSQVAHAIAVLTANPKNAGEKETEQECLERKENGSRGGRPKSKHSRAAIPLIETDVFKFNGVPTLHFRILKENFLTEYDKQLASLCPEQQEDSCSQNPISVNNTNRLVIITPMDHSYKHESLTKDTTKDTTKEKELTDAKNASVAISLPLQDSKAELLKDSDSQVFSNRNGNNPKDTKPHFTKEQRDAVWNAIVEVCAPDLKAKSVYTLLGKTVTEVLEASHTSDEVFRAYRRPSPTHPPGLWYLKFPASKTHERPSIANIPRRIGDLLRDEKEILLANAGKSTWLGDSQTLPPEPQFLEICNALSTATASIAKTSDAKETLNRAAYEISGRGFTAKDISAVYANPSGIYYRSYRSHRRSGDSESAKRPTLNQIIEHIGEYIEPSGICLEKK